MLVGGRDAEQCRGRRWSAESMDKESLDSRNGEFLSVMTLPQAVLTYDLAECHWSALSSFHHVLLASHLRGFETITGKDRARISDPGEPTTESFARVGLRQLFLCLIHLSLRYRGV